MATTEIVNIQRRAENVTIAPQQAGYSKVRIHAGTDENDNEIIYEAGDDSGAVFEIDNPFGSPQMAANILADIAGMQYQPGKAEGALIDPAAELGDSIVANNAYFGMYIRATEFGRLMKSDAEAPTQQEIEHEFGVEGSTEREYIRATRGVKAMLQVQAAEIAAKVSVEDRNTSTGFGWSLTQDQWRVGTYSGSSLNPVLTIDENGLTVYGSGTFSGEVNATSGTIGGLTISNNSISSSNGNFRVDSAGNLYATNGTFAGSVYAKNIQYGTSGGVDRGYFPGGGLSSGSVGAGKIVPYDLSTGQFVSGVNNSLGFANFSNAVFHGNDVAPYVAANFYLIQPSGSSAQYSMTLHTHTFRESSGKIYIGGADWTGGDHFFNIADTQKYKDDVSAAGVSYVTKTMNYNSSTHKYSITINVYNHNNERIYTETFYTGTNAYDAGYSAGRSSSNRGVDRIYISGVFYDDTVGIYAYHKEGGYDYARLGAGDTWDGYN